MLAVYLLVAGTLIASPEVRVACGSRLGPNQSFSDPSSFTVEMDGTGATETVEVRTYRTRRWLRSGGSKWISFSFRSREVARSKPFFRYRYGSAEAAYWVYRVGTCDANGDGRADLVFYAGDDTSEETVVLLNTGSSFRETFRYVDTE
jgi:hypothetical protein